MTFEPRTLARAVQRFERALNGQSGSVSWRPLSDYSVEARRVVEGKHPGLIKRVFRPARVIDAGCGPDGALVSLLGEIGVQAWGFDPHPPGGLEFRSANLLVREQMARFGRYDLVICREVLEHLPIRAIPLAVEHLCLLSSRYVYVTTRFAKRPRRLLSFEMSDGLDPTHMSMLSKPFVRLLFVLQGFRSRRGLERRLDWQHKGRCLVMERACSDRAHSSRHPMTIRESPGVERR